jgi:hypothetical protein
MLRICDHPRCLVNRQGRKGGAAYFWPSKLLSKTPQSRADHDRYEKTPPDSGVFGCGGGI